ncbi:MAG: XdhC family protein [Eudoraea sp.]|nr:XdhC family protein [Eudoraea sp.]
MKEIKSILSLYNKFKSSNEKAAIAQVVRVEESSYRREGARMLVFESGVFEGGISGGCLEGDALKRSQMAIFKEKPSIVTYDTSKDDENQIGVGLGCNGVIDVLISPITSTLSTIPLLEKCVSSRQSHVLITITACPEDPELLGTTYYFDTKENTIEGGKLDLELKEYLLKDIKSVANTKKSNIYNYQLSEKSVSVFVELIPPQFHLVIYGDNYDVYPMLELAKVMDWEVSLVGNIQKLKKEKLATVKHIISKGDKEEPFIDDRTAIILMAHDFKTDMSNLKLALESEAAYIASLGPKKRFIKMENEFKEQGQPLSKTSLDRIYAPCGLELGANTPEEIATSIFAEILAVFAGKKGGMLRDKAGPIHQRN